MAVKILCAAKGEGKTTFLCAQAAGLVAGERTIGGVAAPAVFEREQRIGYDLLDLRTGTRRPLARAVTAPDVTPTVGGYHLDEAAVVAGTAAIAAAVRDRLDVIAIDEVGPLEFEGRGWASALELALLECSPSQELIVVVRPTLVHALAARFPSPQWATAERVSPPWPPTLWP